MRRITACAAAATMSVALGAVAAPAAAAKDQPFRASMSGWTAVGEGAFDGDVADRCREVSGPGVSVTTLEGTGTASHLGRVSVWTEYCVHGTTGVYGDGELRLTAANGDALVGTFSRGQSYWIDEPAGVLGFVDELVFGPGGTGRFSSASGGGVESGSYDVATGDWTLEITGVLDKRG